MAIAAAYATVDEYKAVKGLEFDSTHDLVIGRQLLAMSRGLDRKLAQPTGFNKDEAVTNRLYVGSGTRCLAVEPIASTVGLVIKVNASHNGDFSGETAFPNTDYQLRPLNADKGPEPQPWTQIYLPDWSTRGYWGEGYGVQVTGIHGWPEVPEAIRLATIELTAMALRIEGAYATGRIQELDQVENASPQARAQLRGLYERYNRYPVAVG